MSFSSKLAGNLDIIIGPMFSGKTTELLTRVSLAAVYRTVLIICSNIDTRSGSGISTHGMFSTKTTADVITTVDLNNVDVAYYDVIAIDEAQFFNDLSPVKQWLEDGKDVIISSLDGDFNRNHIGYIHTLLPICRSIVKRLAICFECAKNNTYEAIAPYSFKIAGDKNKIIDAGSDDKYIAVCGSHWNLLNKKKNINL